MPVKVLVAALAIGVLAALYTGLQRRQCGLFPWLITQWPLAGLITLGPYVAVNLGAPNLFGNDIYQGIPVSVVTALLLFPAIYWLAFLARSKRKE